MPKHSNDPHAIVKRLNKGPERAVIHPGAIVNFVAAGDQLDAGSTREQRNGRVGPVDLVEPQQGPRQVVRYCGTESTVGVDDRTPIAAGDPQGSGRGRNHTRPVGATLWRDACPRADDRSRTSRRSATAPPADGQRPACASATSSADTAAMLFRALLASGQINMRKVDGWQSLATKPIDQPIDLAA